MDSTAERLHIEIHGLCGRMQQKIWRLSHRTFLGIQREFVRKSGSGSRRVGRGWEEVTVYPAMRNHSNCVDLGNLGKSEWDQELGKIEKSSWKFSMPTSKQTKPMDSSSDHCLLQRRSYLQRWSTADYSCVWTTEPSTKPSPTDPGDARQDLSNSYHLIRTKEGDEYKTAFRTQHGQFKSRVIPFWVDERTSYNTNQRR